MKKIFAPSLYQRRKIPTTILSFGACKVYVNSQCKVYVKSIDGEIRECYNNAGYDKIPQFLRFIHIKWRKIYV